MSVHNRRDLAMKMQVVATILVLFSAFVTMDLLEMELLAQVCQH